MKLLGTRPDLQRLQKPWVRLTSEEIPDPSLDYPNPSEHRATMRSPEVYDPGHRCYDRLEVVVPGAIGIAGYSSYHSLKRNRL